MVKGGADQPKAEAGRTDQAEWTEDDHESRSDHQGQSQNNGHWDRTSRRETAALQDGEQQGSPFLITSVDQGIPMNQQLIHGCNRR